MSNKVIANFKSESGDSYFIPTAYYDYEVRSYKEAVERGDERVMLHFEEGGTGWIYVDA